MARLTQISPATATDRTREQLESVKAELGLVPNMIGAMANAPAVLDGYLRLSASLGKGRLPARVREQIALAVAQANGCEYGLAAHSAVGQMVGLTAEQVRDARLGTVVDPKAASLVRFARRVLEARGRVVDDDLAEVRRAGFDDGAIVEVVANVALGILTNYLNLVAQTDLDFPAAPSLADPAEIP